MITSPEINELCTALAAAQGSFAPVRKDRVNPAYKSRYATLDSLLAAVRPALTEHGLALLQSVETVDAGALLTVRSRLAHKSGQWVETSATVAVVDPRSKGAPGIQVLGSHISYLRRYCAGALLCVAPDEDDDGEAQHDRTPAAPPPPPDPDEERYRAALGLLRDLYRGIKGGLESAEALRTIGRLLPEVDRLAKTGGARRAALTSALGELAKACGASDEAGLREGALAAAALAAEQRAVQS